MIPGQIRTDIRLGGIGVRLESGECGSVELVFRRRRRDCTSALGGDCVDAARVLRRCRPGFSGGC